MGGSPAKTQTGTGGSTETANSVRGDGTSAVPMEEQWGVLCTCVEGLQRRRSVQPEHLRRFPRLPPVEQEGTVPPSRCTSPARIPNGTYRRDGDDDAGKVAEPLSQGSEETLTDNVDDGPGTGGEAETGGDTEENWEEYGMRGGFRR